MKIYVGNLAQTTSSQDITDLFAQHGEVVTVNIIKDKFSGESRGFGFVEMTDATAAQAAIAACEGADLQGMRLRVSEAHPRPERGAGGFGGGDRRPRSGGGGNGGGWGDRSGGPRRSSGDRPSYGSRDGGSRGGNSSGGGGFKRFNSYED